MAPMQDVNSQMTRMIPMTTPMRIRPMENSFSTIGYVLLKQAQCRLAVVGRMT